MSLELQFCPELHQINREEWNALAKGHYPFLQYDFLMALEKSGAVDTDSGWQPFHLKVCEKGKTVAVMPLYIKTHSYGEYVFDWSWADAYRRYGYHYYPKLLSAIPFTPVTGARLLCASGKDEDSMWQHVTDVLQQQSRDLGLSSVHILYPDTKATKITVPKNWGERQSVQFQWYNRDYHSFDHFLESFASRKRKNVKKERTRVNESGIETQRYFGNTLNATHLEFFYQCYKQTYLKRSGHTGYLNESFFQLVFETMADHILIVQASKEEQPIASALYFYDENGLYGRYWGALQESDGLHFECCYYQGIEFCIEQNIPLFNPGTQGEHKIQRGFEPTLCYSRHWLEHSEFNIAILDFIEREKKQTESLLPFKKSKD